MCLTVFATPSSIGACAVEKVRKELCCTAGGEPLCTPIMGEEIPKSGWLAAYRKMHSDLTAGAELGACCVHSFCRRGSLEFGDFHAYAVGVIAWGRSYDVGSVLLYIPSCDRTSNRVATTQALNQIFRMPLTISRWNAVRRLVEGSLPRSYLRKLIELENYNWQED